MTATDYSVATVRPPEKKISLKALAIRGVGWTLIEAGTAAVMRLGGNLVLTRLLFPEAFGLMSIVRVVTNGINMFSDVGITAAVIQNPRGDQSEFLNTAWVIQIARGMLIALVICLLAQQVASFYGEPILGPMLYVAALTSALTGFQSIRTSWAQRQLELSGVTVWRISTSLANLIATILLAWYFRSVWALVAGSVIGSTTSLVLSYVCLRGPKNRWQWDSASAREILKFGKWIFLASVLGFVASQSDRILLPKWMSFETLGVYSIALMIVEMPRRMLKQVASRVIFPVVSRRKGIPRDQLRRKVISHRQLPVFGVGMIALLLAVFGDKLVLFLWDARYADAAWMLSILGLGLWPSALTTTASPVLIALGRPEYLTFALFARCLHLAIVLPLGFLTYGLIGMVVAVATIPLSSYLIVCWALRRESVSTIQFDVISSAVFFVTVAATTALRFVLGFGWPIELAFQ